MGVLHSQRDAPDMTTMCVAISHGGPALGAGRVPSRHDCHAPRVPVHPANVSTAMLSSRSLRRHLHERSFFQNSVTLIYFRLTRVAGWFVVFDFT